MEEKDAEDEVNAKRSHFSNDVDDTQDKPNVDFGSYIVERRTGEMKSRVGQKEYKRPQRGRLLTFIGIRFVNG